MISARLDFKKCQDKLKSQINDSDTVRKDINELSEELNNKQNTLKTLHLEFEKLVSITPSIHLEHEVSLLSHE